MKTRFIALVTIAALAGCAQNHVVWTKPGATAADFELQKNVCDYQSEIVVTPIVAAPSPTLGDAIAQGIVAGSRKAELMQLCMRANGWTPTIRPAVQASASAKAQQADSPEALDTIYCRLPDGSVIQSSTFYCRGNGVAVPESEKAIDYEDQVVNCRTKMLKVTMQLPRRECREKGEETRDQI